MPHTLEMTDNEAGVWQQQGDGKRERTASWAIRARSHLSRTILVIRDWKISTVGLFTTSCGRLLYT